MEGIAVTHPRPGHADLSGAIKYRQDDCPQYPGAFERQGNGGPCGGRRSLRESFSRKSGIELMGYVTEIGGCRRQDSELDYPQPFCTK